MDRMTVALRLGSAFFGQVNLHPALFAHAAQTQTICYNGTRYVVQSHELHVDIHGGAAGVLRLRVEES